MSYSVVNDLAKAMKALDGKKIDFVVTPFSFVVRSSPSLLPLCFGVSCPFPVSRLTVSPVLSLLAFPLFPASDSSGRRLVRVVRALAPPLSLSLLFCFLLHPRVLCLVFLAADWSGFPAPPSSPSFLLSFTSLIPDLFSRRDLRLSVIFLAADWSGVSHCWLSSQTIPPPSQAHSLAADWSGALLLTTYSWYSSQDNKQSSHV